MCFYSRCITSALSVENDHECSNIVCGSAFMACIASEPALILLNIKNTDMDLLIFSLGVQVLCHCCLDLGHHLVLWPGPHQVGSGLCS